MKATTKKKTIKKVKAVAKSAKKQSAVLVKGAKKQTGTLIKKVNKEADKIAKAFKKEWKEGEPQREVYKAEIEKAAKKAGVKGMKMAKKGLKNSIKIGGDVVEVIRKDIKEIRKQK